MRKFAFSVVLALFFLPAVASAVPDLVLKDIEGRSHSVRDYIGKGKWTVVTVWSADCPICRRDIYHMAFFHAEHKNGNASVLGLSVDGEEGRAKAARFVQDQHLDFPNLLGDGDTPSELTGVRFFGTPSYYLFSPDGKLAAQRVGPVTQEEMEKLIARLSKEREGKGG